MKCLLLAAVGALAFGTVADAAAVRGYVRRDGTYVAPHYRSAPNSTTYDNYSTRGNVNPYTGSRGTASPTPSYGAVPTYRAPSYSSPSYGIGRPPSGGSSYGRSPFGSSYGSVFGDD